MLIPIIIEPNLIDTIWCKQLSRHLDSTILERNYQSVYIDGNDYQNTDYNELFKKNPRLLILFGTSPSWLRQAILYLSGKGIRIVLLGNDSRFSSQLQGQVYFDYELSVHQLLDYFSACNCKGTALYGVFENSSSDLVKKNAFLCHLRQQGIPDGESRVFENKNNLKKCYDDFYKRISEFDSAICVNEIVAVSLAHKLRLDGVNVPNDFQILTYGSSNLTILSSPRLSTYIVDHHITAVQAIRLYKFLFSADDPNIHVTIKLSGDIIKRESTSEPVQSARVSSYEQPVFTSDTPNPNFYDDRTVTYFSKFEELLQSCDDLDFDILQRVLKKIPYERIAEELHTARNTVIYRLSKIQNSLSVKNKKELIEFLKSNQFDDLFKQ